MSNIIIMTFSPGNIVGCFLKKRLTKGGGGSRAPQDAPSLRPCYLQGLPSYPLRYLRNFSNKKDLYDLCSSHHKLHVHVHVCSLVCELKTCSEIHGHEFV